MTSPRQNRPRRQFKSDRLIHGSLGPDEVRCDYAVAPLDRLAEQMDRKWGIDRLPELVSVETAERYGSAMAKLNAAIEAQDVEETKLRAQVCMRGLAAMDREAEAVGAVPASPDVLEVEIDGFHFGIMPDGRNWKAAQEARPDLQLFTLREIAVSLKAMRIDHPLIAETKAQFPGAEIVRIAERAGKINRNPEDEIPF